MIKKILAFFLLITFSFGFKEGIFANNNQSNDEIIFTSENKKIIIYEDSIKINGEYYTKQKFEELLKTSEKVTNNNSKIQTRAAIVLAGVNPGIYYIAGIGAIKIAYDGAIWVGGQVVEAGTWVYESIKNFFSEKAKKDSYNKDKKDGKPTDNHSTKKSKKGDSNLPTKSDPYSSKDLIENGKIKQRRYYDENGNAQTDIDYFHTDNGTHTFPHRHDWINGVRNKAWYK